MKPSSHPSWHTRTGYRLVSALLGAGLIGLGGYLLFWDVRTTPAILVSTVLLMLGGNMVYAGWRGTVSWLARIGPLP
ncbi:MAG: hypothetical protein ACLGHE_05905 [Gammaproteobacteria bacterium]